MSKSIARIAPTVQKESIPIVGIGASAGGLEAFSQLLGQLPENSGMVFVLVQHLAPKHESALSELLGRTTKIPVTEVKNGMAVKPDHVYVIPPNANMAILDGVLHLMPRSAQQHHMPIDYFFRSLAEDRGNKAIGVILSGTASDGTLGVKAIKAEGGITFAQDEKSARYPDMPKNAVASGCVDFVMPPKEIARELLRVAVHPYLLQPQAVEEKEFAPEAEDYLKKIFVLLRSATGVDFTHYKPSTVKRRIKRRMVVHRIPTLKDYLAFLHENRGELEGLYQDILIHVTGFFRDPGVFEALKHKVYPQFTANRRPGSPVRIWVPGCSTGEEVYSIAITLLEFLSEKVGPSEVQMFATDISENAVEKARTGRYTENISADVSPERLRRFFTKLPSGYEVSKSIRDMCVFARQDVTRDPPFSRLDLISCRNLLIYLALALQKKVLPVFHYALNPGGFLLLGNSETVGGFNDHFECVDKKHKIFAKKSVAVRLPLDFHRGVYAQEGEAVGKNAPEALLAVDVQKEADRIILSKYAPPGVLVNSDLEILQFRGRTGQFLEHASGQASLSLSKMVREGLLVDLRATIQKAKKEDAPVRKQGIQVRSDGRLHEMNVEVVPVKGPSPAERCFLILFYDAQSPVSGEPRKALRASSARERRAEARELAVVKEDLAQTEAALQSIIEEQESTNEELKSANEEILSSNEELQSTNEELETAKEELQSTNEELTTLNEELQNRNAELSAANGDLVNVLGSINIPVLILSSDLRIWRFTSAAEKLFNLIPTDVGRPISDIKGNLELPHLTELISDSIDNVALKELEVQDGQGRYYTMRIRPYKTIDNKIEGAVLTWVDISSMKASMRQSSFYADAIAQTARQSMLILDASLRVKSANENFYRSFRVSPSETQNRFIYDLGNGQWNIPKLRKALEDILPQNRMFQDFEVEHEFPDIGRHTMMLNGRRIEDGNTELILLAIEDFTERLREQRLAEDRFRLIFDGNLAGACRSTPDGEIVECNAAFATLFGYGSPQELSGRQASLFESPAERAGLFEQLKRTGGPILVTLPRGRKDGTPLTVRISAALVDGAQGQRIEVIALEAEPGGSDSDEKPAGRRALKAKKGR